MLLPVECFILCGFGALSLGIKLQRSKTPPHLISISMAADSVDQVLCLWDCLNWKPEMLGKMLNFPLRNTESF